MKKILFAFCVMVLSVGFSNTASAQLQGPGGGSNAIFGLGFNRSATVWWPFETADYNAGFKAAFNDIEAFVNMGAQTGVMWSMRTNADGNIESVLVDVIYVDAYHASYIDEMINLYYDRADNPIFGSEDYRRGLWEGANIWSSISLLAISN
ncbi:hypothetical protein [Pedobacter helvus]|uniref:Uncharacterized protein n=1 Tax=Pedobacter helvus TaxID=2563444 RepID=A0ABW9JD73_9SPHI|nr:hypothetical protein [Pedobacter ureilyticus]